MKKGMTTWLIVGGAVVLIGAVGFFLLRKPKGQESTSSADNTPNPTTNDAGSVVVVEETKPAEVPYVNMGFVQKSNTPLVTILKGPTLFSGQAKKVENFTTIYARPSKSGWYEVSEDGVTTLGYVPNGTLRKL
jgi:hypothetical protein